MYRVLIFILCMFLSGCTTSQLWQPQPDYIAQVNGFYVNKETSDLVVTTEIYAYLFPSQQQLGQVLMLSREVEFTPEFNNFSLTSSNVITGKIKLTLLDEKPSTELINQLTAAGFMKRDVNGRDRYQLVREVRGERYTIDGELPLEKLENEYPVRMSMPRGGLDTARRVVVTPFTLAFDATAGVIAIPFMAYYSVIFHLYGP